MTASERTKRLIELERAITECRRCPRLVAWRESVAADPPKRHRGEEYWARPVPGFGDPNARILVHGLAPAANGGNRTGRPFTGDRSGDWLFAAIHRAGLSNQPESVGREDGLKLRGTFVNAAVRCAPPENKPLPAERDSCAPWLEGELELLAEVKVVIALGGFAWEAMLRTVRGLGGGIPKPKPKFGHGAEVSLDAPAKESWSGPASWTLLGCFHPSPLNTQTGRLSAAMLDDIFDRAREIAGPEPFRPA
ncbi:MAG: uracil-DNA glycosylase [Thermoleophilales bacterium]|nr:uracil-DNA glycosylase [Thermoleophilales bacterium]